MSSPDSHTLTGAYAVDALEDGERARFETHLSACPDCAREVEELRATAAWLGLAVAENPPQSLRHKVMAQVSRTRQDSPARPAAMIRTRIASRDPLASRDGITSRAGRTGWAVRLSAVAAALAALVILGAAALRSGRERDAADAELAQVQAQYASVAQLVTAPDARGDSGVGVQGGTAFVLASHKLNKGVLLVSDLPTPPRGHTYQAWLIGSGHLRSIGLITVPAATRAAPLAFRVPDDARKIGLTLEPTGGSPQPTTTPVVLFDLPT